MNTSKVLVKTSIPPLTQSAAAGRPYVRSARVEAEIGRALAVDPATWTAMAARAVGSTDSLSNEAIVHLIRTLRIRGEQAVLGRLVDLLGQRITRIAERWAQGFDPTTTEEIVIQIGEDMVALILSETPSRQSEFLEIAFYKAVQRRTLNEVEKRKHYPRPHHIAAPVIDPNRPEDDAIDPIYMLEEEGPNPEEIAIAVEARAQVPELVRAGLAAIKDPRHREAVILHHLQGWPISDQNTAKATLCTHFGVSDRQIRNWMKIAFGEIRQAIGDKI